MGFPPAKGTNMVNTSGITFGGLGSGLDTQAIITQLVALERLPIRQIENDRDDVQTKIDRIGQFQTLVDTLRETAEGLSTPRSLLGPGRSRRGRDDRQCHRRSCSPCRAAHTIDVQRLASVDRWAFDGVSDPTQDLGLINGQGVSFTVGTTNYDIAVDADESSMTEIAAAINQAAGEAVSASVVNTGTESNPSYQLVMASKESGEDGRLFNLSSTLPGFDHRFLSPRRQRQPPPVSTTSPWATTPKR